MPDAQTFEAFDAEVAQGFGVAAVYAAADAAGTARGYCVKVAQNGYGGAISAVVGVGLDGKVTGGEHYIARGNAGAWRKY